MQTLQADNDRITISEADGAPTEVVLRSTLPVLCKAIDRPYACHACTTVATDGGSVTVEQVSLIILLRVRANNAHLFNVKATRKLSRLLKLTVLSKISDTLLDGIAVFLRLTENSLGK